MAKDKLPTITLVTPWLKLRWPKITNPDTEGKFADGKYKTYGVPFSDEDFDKVEKALLDAAESKEFKAYFAKEGVTSDDPPTIPVKEFKNRDTGKLEEKGFNFKSKYRPGIFDGKRKKLPVTAKIGTGSEARIEAVLFPWAKSEKVKVKDAKTGKIKVETQTGYGVSMRFASAQLRKLVEGGGASDGSAFDDGEAEDFEYEAQTNDDGEVEGDQFDL